VAVDAGIGFESQSESDGELQFHDSAFGAPTVLRRLIGVHWLEPWRIS
jgi:hypothetical protein